jgi:YVTN family beta-propeller protein
MVLTDKGMMGNYLVLSVVLLTISSIVTMLSYHAAAADSLFQQIVNESSILNINTFKSVNDILRSQFKSDDLLLMASSIIDISTDKPRYPQEIRRNTTATNNSLDYENSIFRIELQYPSDWNKVEGESNVSFSSPLENDSDSFQENLLIEIKPSGNIPLEDLVSLEIIEYRQNNSDFKLLDSVRDKIAGKPGYKMVYEYSSGQEFYKVMQVRTVIEGRTYLVKYTAESEKFPDYLPTIQRMINSIYVQETLKPPSGIKYPELSVSSNPFDIAINPVTDRLYITNLHFGTVSVIDGSTDRLITEIKVGNFPSGLSVDPEINKIYVTNSRSDTVSVIDGSTNSIAATIMVGDKPNTVAIDTTEEGVDSLVFVANSDSDMVSVIDASENIVVANLTVGNAPSFLTVNPIINRLYVTNQESNTVSVIDYFISDGGIFENTTMAEDIRVGRYPTSISLNPVTNKLFVTNYDSDTVSVIDGSTNIVVDEIKVGSHPYSVAVNPDTNMFYIANYGSDTVSVIDGSTNIVDEIKVGSFPVIVSRNPVTNIIYVSNFGSNTISEIDKNSIVAGITFHIIPSNSGFIECNGMRISDGHYVRYNINKTVNCKANASPDSVFRSWTSNLPFNATRINEITFKPSDYGNVTGNFFVPQVFSNEVWDQLRGNMLSLMIPILISVIAGWFVPAIARWLNSYRQRGYLRRCIITITTIHDTSSRNEEEHLKRFEEARRRIDDLLTEGKISEQQYGILNDKISEYEDDIGKS